MSIDVPGVLASPDDLLRALVIFCSKLVTLRVEFLNERKLLGLIFESRLFKVIVSIVKLYRLVGGCDGAALQACDLC
jgi:hypothetical protein